MDNSIEIIEKYPNVINVLSGKYGNNIFAYCRNCPKELFHDKLSGIAEIKVSGLYPEQPEKGRLRSGMLVTTDITAVIDRECNIAIKGCWAKSDINRIRDIIGKIIKCTWLRIAPEREFGRYELNNPYLFVLKGKNVRGNNIITPLTESVPTGIWKVVECDIDDFEDRYKEYYLKDKTQNRRNE